MTADTFTLESLAGSYVGPRRSASVEGATRSTLAELAQTIPHDQLLLERAEESGQQVLGTSCLQRPQPSNVRRADAQTKSRAGMTPLEAMERTLTSMDGGRRLAQSCE